MGRLALLLLAASRASAAAADEPGADALPGLPFLIVTTQRSGSTWLASMPTSTRTCAAGASCSSGTIPIT